MIGLPIINLSFDPLIILRRAKFSDLDFIRKVSHIEMDSIYPGNWESWFEDIKMFIRETPVHSHKIFVIEVQGDSVGYIWFNEEVNSIWITAIVLQSEYQRRNIGQRVMNYLINESRKEGKEFIELGVQHNNKNALQFYYKLGFEQFDHVKSVNTDLIRLKLT